MITRTFGRKLAAALMASAMLAAPAAEACTGITLTAADGSVVRARTMEFGVDLQSDVIVSPRNYERTGETPDQKPGLSWKAKYASVGTNGAGLPVIVDGLNEKGLSVGIFYFDQSAQFQPYDAADPSKTIAPWQLGSYILDNFAGVEEVKAALPDINVAPVVLEQFKIVLPVHYIVTEESGKSIVIEYVDGKLSVQDNPLGVITNNPPFDWHMTNLKNYVNLDYANVEPKKLGDLTISGFGQGTGMLGAPGDFTSPSRFVRAAFFQTGVAQGKTSDDAIFEAFHILNNFDIPKGSVREMGSDGQYTPDYTQWTSADDLSQKRFYFRTYDNSTIRFVDLLKQDLDAKDIKTIKMDGYETAEEVGN
ncbi:linear amide C-N hydrolase [Martelella endophytica]|uniref:Choloylglycine hydrolase n=1 Tax=Martelella endophytica TaxID=1486262 RepID=A0A0D5LVV1_MAREN|nr:choloylglycine hydrolase family protein [Martelella endophytica]AJY47513.1 choloylglycine hydrolase [Martelella endophytica]